MIFFYGALSICSVRVKLHSSHRSTEQKPADPDFAAVTCNLHQSKRRRNQVLGLKGVLLQLDVNRQFKSIT